MSNAVEDRAETLGWVVIAETASPGLVERISRDHLPRVSRAFDPEAVRRRLTGITGPLSAGALTWSTAQSYVVEMGLRNQVELLTDLLADKGTGLLITLDEIHHNQIAGLGELVDLAGRRVGDDVLEVMVDGSRGYPFLIHLVGAQTWRRHPDVVEISMSDARQGVAGARRRLGSLVYEPALASTSAIDKSFLMAMAKDDRPSKMADTQRRLGVDVNYASQYRLRLISAELIESSGRGYVDYALPYMREYLRDHAASDICQPSGLDLVLGRGFEPGPQQARRRFRRSTTRSGFVRELAEETPLRRSAQRAVRMDEIDAIGGPPRPHGGDAAGLVKATRPEH